MAHEISIRKSGKAEMAYVGELPWHGLGQSVTKGASVDVWRKEAGLDWDAIGTPMLYADGQGILREYAGKQVIRRSDTGAAVGAVSERFQIVQPSEVLEFFRDLTESGKWHIHTAGVLRGGSRIWAMASSNIEGMVKKHDKVRGNLLLATSLDGSMNSTAKLTSVRVVCANTLHIALNAPGASNDPTVKISHRSAFRPDEVKESLGVALDSFDAFMLEARKLAEVKIDTTQARDILRQVFGQPTEKEINQKAADAGFQALLSQFESPGKKLREQRSVGRALSLFAGEGMGANLPGSVGTAWGLLNAVTQHIDHERGRSADTRMESAWFGLGDEQKTQAKDLLCELL